MGLARAEYWNAAMMEDWSKGEGVCGVPCPQLSDMRANRFAPAVRGGPAKVGSGCDLYRVILHLPSP
jgi:hypothetical protein